MVHARSAGRYQGADQSGGPSDEGCLGGAEEMNSEQLINRRIYCRAMDEAANIQSVLKIFWKECRDGLWHEGCQV